MPAILFVEDDATIAMGVEYSLKQDGFQVSLAYCLGEARDLLKRQPFDLVLLDLGLPDGDGLDVTRRLREWSTAPIVVVSARGQEADKVAALDAGADDYLTKPFGMPELLARLRVAERHAAQVRADVVDPVFEASGLRVDLATRRVMRDGQELHLTRLEYKLLATLVRYAGRVVTHRQLLKEVWGPSAVNESQYLRVYMTQLRHKIEKDPARPSLLTTEIGVGYRLCAESVALAPD